MMTINQKVKLIVDTCKYSMKKMEGLCGLAPSTISKIINQKHTPSYGTILRISKGTKIPILYLIDDRFILKEQYILEQMFNADESDSSQELIVSSLSDDPIDCEVMSLMKNLNPSQKQVLLSVAKAFSKINEPD